MTKSLLPHLLVEVAKGWNNEENMWISCVSMENLFKIKDKNRVTVDIKRETQKFPPCLIHCMSSCNNDLQNFKIYGTPHLIKNSVKLHPTSAP